MHICAKTQIRVSKRKCGEGVMRLKLNNKGAALISVLVVTTFVTIIATTMLYMAAMNYQQKLTDYQNKQSFYGAEKALDELKSILVGDVQEAYVKAYNKTTRQFLVLKTAQARNEYFQDAFIHELNEKWETRVSTGGDNLTAVRSVMTGAYATEADSIYRVLDYGVYETTTSTGTAKKFALRGVQTKYTSGAFTTFIYTDICLEPPQIDWSDTYSNAGDSVTEAVERDTIAFTDYVYYVNWRKADYDEGAAGGYDNIEGIGTKVSSP